MPVNEHNKKLTGGANGIPSNKENIRGSTSCILDNESIPSNLNIIKKGRYSCVKTKYAGIYKIIDPKNGYLCTLDFGRVPKINKTTHKVELKQCKTNKVAETLQEALDYQKNAEKTRNERKYGLRTPCELTTKNRAKVSDVIKEYEKSSRFLDYKKDYQRYQINHLNHFEERCGNYEFKKVNTTDIENYYKYLQEVGNYVIVKDGENQRVGLSLSSIQKHRVTLRQLWDFALDAGVVGVYKNVVDRAQLPKEVIMVGGKAVVTNKIKPKTRSYNLEEVNYTLNDLIQNEKDRNCALLFALGVIGGLRRGEVSALKIGKVFHDERMDVDEELFDYGGYDYEYYRSNPNLMFIDENRVDGYGEIDMRLPKCNKVRIVAVPEVLKEIINWALEQREDFVKATNTDFESDYIYYPLVNVIKKNIPRPKNIYKRWMEYQKRRNKRMIEKGLEPIQIIRFHDLRHTHANLLKESVMDWKISYNLGHSLEGSTTKTVYMSDERPDRDAICKFFDENIKIDWSKAPSDSFSDPDNVFVINNSGHLITSSEDKNRIKKLGLKLVLTEEELNDLIFLKKEQLDDLEQARNQACSES